MSGRRSCLRLVKKFLLNQLSVFKLPLTLCDELMRHIRAYWWGSENGHRKVQWVPWEKMIMPKGFGGMGFRDLRLVNQALLARQAWRLAFYPESLCARVLKAKYFPNGNCWTQSVLETPPLRGAELSMGWHY